MRDVSGAAHQSRCDALRREFAGANSTISTCAIICAVCHARPPVRVRPPFVSVAWERFYTALNERRVAAIHQRGALTGEHFADM